MLLCSCTNPILGENLVPEIQECSQPMLSANQIAGFLNQLFFQEIEEIDQIQAPLGTRPSLGTEPHYETPGDLRVEYVKTQ